MSNKSMGSFLSELRKEKGITQRELAEILNVSDKTVSHWERDEHSPDLSMLPLLAEFFGVSCDELIKGEKRSDSIPSGSHSFSNVAHQSENFVKNPCEEKIYKSYTKHKILCLSSVFISFFSLMLLIGIILLAEHITGLDFIKTALCISAVFAVALCLLITFISSQSFSSVINTAEISEKEKRKLKAKSRLNYIFPLFYVVLVLIIFFKVLMPVNPPSSNEPITMPVPSSVKPDTSYYDNSIDYAATSEFVY
ncbi:MAG: helix-turn-helix transcriptional regulator [Acutalibacteraceae bacterium]|nr:helix-turn-helix transcriptional regulator [Acutalibacteraceae bacterium]